MEKREKGGKWMGAGVGGNTLSALGLSSKGQDGDRQGAARTKAKALKDGEAAGEARAQGGGKGNPATWALAEGAAFSLQATRSI